MPTKYRRIAVVEDPKLAEAMRRAAPHLNCRSSASLLRELAIRGASTIDSEAKTSPGLQRILEIPGIRPATGDWQSFLDQHPPQTPQEGSDPYAASKALKEQREERV